MTDNRKTEIAEILQSAQNTKWAYAEIKAFWEALPSIPA